MSNKTTRFNVSGFRSQLRSRGYVLPANKFLMRFTPPNGLLKTAQYSRVNTGSGGNGKDPHPTDVASEMSMYCEASNIPGLTFLTSEIRRYGYGAPERKPYAAIFTDMPLTFMADSDGINLRYFQDWMKLVINYDARRGYNVATGIQGAQYPHESAYKADYASDIELLVFDGAETSDILTYTLREAYPVQLIDTPLNWSDNNTYLKFSVMFTFTDWYEKVLTAAKR